MNYEFLTVRNLRFITAKFLSVLDKSRSRHVVRHSIFARLIHDRVAASEVSNEL